MRLRALPIFLAFFAMGFGDVVGTLVGFATERFALSRAEAGLLPFLGLAMFGILSVPGGILADRKGRKPVLMLGLLLALVGLLIPVAFAARYALLLLAILLLGAGMTVLQVAGNPLMRDVSAPGRYSRNLTFAQFVKSLGSLSGPLLATWLIAAGWGWTGLFPLYAAFVALTLASVAPLSVEREMAPREGRATLASSVAPLRDPYVASMVLGLFLYVGAEVGMNAWIATYLSDTYGLAIESTATLGIGFFFFALMIGRLLGSAVLHWVPARTFFVATSGLACVGLLGLFLQVQPIAIASIFVIGLAFGNVFPLIFSILIDEMPAKSNELSGLMCMAIVGGAVMPLTMGLIADHSVTASFLVPLGSLGFILATALASLRRANPVPSP